MKRTILILTALVALTSSGVFGADNKAEKGKDWYLKQYPYLDTGYFCTFETEFKLPEGFRRLEPKTLTPFQTWVSNMPLWDDGKAVFQATSSAIPRDKISRPVRYNWRTGNFRDCVIPLQMLADYEYWTDNPYDLNIITKMGDTVTYRRFLESEISYTPNMNISFRPSMKRPPSDAEFTRFVDLCAFNTSYASLEANCRPVTGADLRPGDLYVGRDSLGERGKVYVIMVVAADGRGEYRYVVGTGCAEPCDLYLPLFHNDRNNPWLTPDELKGLLATYPVAGFYRLRAPGKK